MALNKSLVLALCLVGLAVLATASPKFEIPGVGKKEKAIEAGQYVSLDDDRVAENGNPEDQSISIGRFSHNDKLLMQETAQKDSMFMISRDTTILYPKKDQAGEKITGIKIIDQRQDGKNAEVRVKAGGVGHDFVKLRFDSQRNHGFNYLVQIFGEQH